MAQSPAQWNISVASLKRVTGPHGRRLAERARGTPPCIDGLGGHKLQGCAINTVAEPRRLGTVVKEMALVPVAAGTVHFGPREDHAVIGRGLDDTRCNGLPKAGPACAAVELRL